MTQPSLSARVKALEEEVGAVLLERDRRNVRLTAAGEIFRDYASSAMVRTEEAVMSARRAAAGESGQLRFGFTGLTTYGGMPELVQRFRGRFPDVEVELVNGGTDHLQAEMLAGHIDVALLHPPLSCTGFDLLDLPSEELVLAVPASSALASLPDIPLSRLQGEPFLLPPRHAGPDLYDQIIRLFHTEGGFSPTVVQEVAHHDDADRAGGRGRGMRLRDAITDRHQQSGRQVPAARRQPHRISPRRSRGGRARYRRRPRR